MNVSFGISNQIQFNPIQKRMSVPSFRGNLAQDVFEKSAAAVRNTDLNAEKLKEAIPEFLYHLTSKKAYESIKKSGCLKASKDLIDGVFMFDIKDFMRNWSKPCGQRGIVISNDLLNQALKSDNGLVLLKIPTKNLNPKKFAIRPEDEVLDFIGSKHYQNLLTVFAEKGGIANNKSELPKTIAKGYSPLKAEGISSSGRAIEYIFKGDIPIKTATPDVISTVDCSFSDIKDAKNGNCEKILETLLGNLIKAE